MLRYIAAAGIASLVLAVALKSQGGATAATTTDEPATAVTVSHERPQVDAEPNEDGTISLRVRHTLAASVSRASLVYRLDDGEHLLDMTNCQRSLARRTGTSIELGGSLPPGARAVRLVLEDETGTIIVPVVVE